MSTKFKTVITTAGAAKLAAATVPGGKKVNLSAMAVGDGNGKLPVPDAGQTKLVHEVWRHALNKVSVDNKNKNYIVAELVVPPEVGGFWMRELGLYDDAGTLIAVSNMAESYKPELAEGSGRAQTCRMVIILSNVASVELSIDASTVMATQDYVDDKIAEHEQSRRHPDATLTEKGFTQLSSATNSTSEKLAATPKAVKAANDNANSRLAKNQNGADIQDKSAFLDNIGVTSLTFMKHNGMIPTTDNLDSYGPEEKYLGTWSCPSQSTAKPESGYPEDKGNGVLEVFNAGRFHCTQRYTTRTGNIYIRMLDAEWNPASPTWSAWRVITSGTRPLSTSIDLNSLGGAEHLGIWRNSSTSIASFERHFPEDGSFGQGILEVFEGGLYGRMQRYTTRSGTMYIRGLTASWDAENPQWEDWIAVGYQSTGWTYSGDLDDLLKPGIYSVTKQATNAPVTDSKDLAVGSIVEVKKRCDIESYIQTYTTVSATDAYKNRTFQRTRASGEADWGEWAEVYNSKSLLTKLGVGGVTDRLSSLDWQTYDFVPGSMITVRLSDMTNIPDGMEWGVIDTNLINITVGPSEGGGVARSMQVWRSTSNKTNYRFFTVRLYGNPGERSFNIRRLPIIDEAQTWEAKQTFSAGLSGELSGNAATATKLKTARKINNVSFDGTSDINLTPKNIGAFASGKTGDTVANDKAVGWNWSSGAYNATTGGASTLILHFNIGEGSCPAAQFRVNYKNGGIFYRSARDGYGFEADWSEFYTTTRKPTAGDVGALSLSGGQLNGALGIGTSSALGGNSIVLGDNDTGFKQNGDGNLDVYANSVHVMRFVSGSIQSNKTINITGRVNPSDYGNFDSRYVKDVRLGSQQYYGVNNWRTWNFQCPSGHVLSGINVQDTGSNSADNIAGVYYRPVQKYINGTWYNVASV